MFLSRLCLFALVVTYCGAADVKDQNRLTRIRRMFNDFEQEERIIHPTRAEGNGPGFTSVRPPVTIPLSHVRYQGTELTTVDVSVGTPGKFCLSEHGFLQSLCRTISRCKTSKSIHFDKLCLIYVSKSRAGQGPRVREDPDHLFCARI